MKEVDGLPLMSWHARPDMSCEYVSPAWLDFTGTTPEYARNGGWARVIHPEDLARWLDACVHAFDERQPLEIEYRLRGRDGAYRWVLDRAIPRYSEEGAFVGFGGVCFDIDEHHRIEHELAQALERERRLRVAAERRVRELSSHGAACGHTSCTDPLESSTGDFSMNWDRIQGNWKQMKGKLKEKWGKLTDDEFDQMGGHRDQLIGKIQERYGIEKDEAERQVKDWESRL